MDGWSGVRCWPLREESVLWLGRLGALWVSDPGGNRFPESDPVFLSELGLGCVLEMQSPECSPLQHQGQEEAAGCRALSPQGPNDRCGRVPRGREEGGDMATGS